MRMKNPLHSYFFWNEINNLIIFLVFGLVYKSYIGMGVYFNSIVWQY